MSDTPTASLTFRDLILAVARKLGIGYYGVNGDEPLQIPNDTVDLDQCKAVVNDAFRMFLSDAPPNGWRWTRLTSQVVLWPSVSVDDDNTLSSAGYDPGTSKTLLTAESDSFYPSMEEKTLTITGVGDFVVADYVSSTQIRVYGDASATDEATWSITADGDYTLPRTFGGSFSGTISYAADTDPNHDIQWGNEAELRRWREGDAVDTGDPFVAAIRMRAAQSGRRRWELMVYPLPDEVLTVEFPHILYFDKMVDLDEEPPSPFEHDEAVQAACLARAEKDYEDALGIDWQYYQNVALPNSMRIDARTAPKRISRRSPYDIPMSSVRRVMGNWNDVTFNP
jgi:hypothetical protein